VYRVSFAGALSFNNLHDFERLTYYLGAAATQSLFSFQGRMAYPDTFVGLVDEEASDPVKEFCEASCELIRAKIAADTDQRLTIGDLICLDRHRKATMAADMHSLDSKLIGTYSSDNKGRNSMRKMAQKMLKALQNIKKKYITRVKGKPGLTDQVRWIMQRPWNYALTPTQQSATTCCSTITKALADEVRARTAEAQRASGQGEQPLAVQATEDLTPAHPLPQRLEDQPNRLLKLLPTRLQLQVHLHLLLSKRLQHQLSRLLQLLPMALQLQLNHLLQLLPQRLRRQLKRRLQLFPTRLQRQLKRRMQLLSERVA
jgi:hypothetical protein